jgi:hypothetical protein
MYENDHPPRHVHIYKDGEEPDRYDLEHDEFMDETIGRHRGRVIRVMRQAGWIE